MPDASITAIHPSGFTIEIHLHNKGYDEVDATIYALEQLGYRPTGSGDGWQRTPAGEPICPKHQVVMRLRQKQHEEWWSHRVIHPQTGEELFCKGYKSPSSPGWEIASSAPGS